MFCGIKKLADCLTTSIGGADNGIIEATMQDIIEIRRFGITQDGTKITYDDFGEPVDLNAQQNYKSWTIKVDMDFESQENDEESYVGGRSSDKESIVFDVVLTEDIQENDVIVYPAFSNTSFRVKKDYAMPKRLRRKITAISEVRSKK